MHAIDFLSPQQLINDLSKSLFGGGGIMINFPPQRQVNPNFTGAISYLKDWIMSVWKVSLGKILPSLPIGLIIMVQKTLPK